MKVKYYTPNDSKLAYSVGVTLDRFIKMKQDLGYPTEQFASAYAFVNWL